MINAYQNIWQLFGLNSFQVMIVVSHEGKIFFKNCILKTPIQNEIKTLFSQKNMNKYLVNWQVLFFTNTILGAICLLYTWVFKLSFLLVGFGIYFNVSVSITIVFCNIFEMANFLHIVTDFEWWMMFLEMLKKCLQVHHIHVRIAIVDCSLHGFSINWKYWRQKETVWIYCSIWTN